MTEELPRNEFEPQCLGCRYSLAGLGKGNCPECGRGFDPAVRESFGPLDKSMRFRRYALWLCRGNGWILNGLTGLALFLQIDAASVGSDDDFGGLIFGTLVLVLIVRAMLALITGVHAQLTLREGLSRWWRWLITPVAIVIAGVSIQDELPLRFRLELSRGALEVVAKSAIVGSAQAEEVMSGSRRYVGLMPVKSMGVQGQQVWFEIGQRGWLFSDQILIEYSPGRQPTRGAKQSVQQLNNEWYLVVQRW